MESAGSADEEESPAASVAPRQGGWTRGDVVGEITHLLARLESAVNLLPPGEAPELMTAIKIMRMRLHPPGSPLVSAGMEKRRRSWHEGNRESAPNSLSNWRRFRAFCGTNLHDRRSRTEKGYHEENPGESGVF